MVGRDELVLHRVGLGGRTLKHLRQFLIGLRLGPSRHLRQVRQFRFDDPFQMALIDADLLQERPHNPLPLRDEAVQQMDRRDLRVAPRCRQFQRPLHRLLGLDRQLVEAKWHVTAPVPTEGKPSPDQTTDQLGIDFLPQPKRPTSPQTQHRWRRRQPPWQPPAAVPRPAGHHGPPRPHRAPWTARAKPARGCRGPR